MIYHFIVNPQARSGLGELKYTIEECKERDATYAAPLKVKESIIRFI